MAGCGSDGSKNTAPQANAQTVETAEDTPVMVTLSGSDAEDDPLTYEIFRAPANGVLTGNGPNLTYTPNPDYYGDDSFSFRVFDGDANSGAILVPVTVTPVNDPPLAIDNSNLSPGTMMQYDLVELYGFATDPDEENTSLKFRWRSSIDGTLWGGNPIVEKNGRFPGRVLDVLSLGSHIITLEVTDSDSAKSSVEIGPIEVVNVAPGWVTETVDEPVQPDQRLASDSSIAVNHARHIVYTDSVEGLLYATDASGSWVTAILDSTGRQPSMKLDSTGNVHVAYSGGGELRYLTNATGDWTSTTLDIGGTHPSLFVDPGGKLHISYVFNGGPRVPKYITNVTGSWVISVIDESVSGGYFYTSIAIDNAGFTHISYQQNKTKELHYATNLTGSWVSTVVDPARGGFYNTLLIDSVGDIHIVHGADPLKQPEEIRYVTNASGSWLAETIPASVGQFAYAYWPHAAIDFNDKIHVNYSLLHDAGFGDFRIVLGYATNESGAWIGRKLDTAEGGISDGSLAIDTGGYVHMSYQTSNYSLKYATNLP